MTNQEINEAVARKLDHAGCDGACPAKYDDESDYEHLADAGTCTCPDYCHSIAAAWELTDKIPYCNLFRGGDWWKLSWLPDQYGQVPYVQSDTAPMAICLAFLKLP